MEFFATAGGISVHISDTQKGDNCLILLHGYLETMYIWNEFIDLISDDYRVIAIDLPGHGLSGSTQVNTMDFDAQTVKEVLDKCGVQHASIGGHSLGGYVALACCDLYPEVFDKLILFNSHPFPDPVEKVNDRGREIGIIENGKLGVLASASIPKMYSNVNLRRLDDKIMETVEICDAHDPQGIVASIKGMMQRPDRQEFLLNTKIPVLLIYGQTDNFMQAEMIDKLKDKFKNVKFLEAPLTGHNSFLEAPDIVLKGVKEFLR
ncbi:MAG: alpha/beta hydrolase [Bacteroidales bacterium]